MNLCSLHLIMVLLFCKDSCGYYVGPEIGNAPGESRMVRTWGAIPNATSLAEAAYLPEVYATGNNIVTFLRSVIPALQPKVDFFAEQIQDTIDTANSKLMQKLENSNNGIIAVENFFTGLMKAYVFGKGPDDEEERRRRVAQELIRSALEADSSAASTTTTTTSTTTNKPIFATTAAAKGSTTTGKPLKRETTTNIATTDSPLSSSTESGKLSDKYDEINVNVKGRDNSFNKMKVISIMQNMLK